MWVKFSRPFPQGVDVQKFVQEIDASRNAPGYCQARHTALVGDEAAHAMRDLAPERNGPAAGGDSSPAA